MSATTLAPVNSAATNGNEMNTRETRRLRLQIPMIVLWLLLLPFTPLLWVGLLIVCVAGGVDPFRGVAAIFRTFAALRGTHVEVDSCQISILLSFF